MTDDPDFPFTADHDPVAERAAVGPVDRRDLVGTLVVAAIGALLVGLIGVIAVLELTIGPGELGAVALTGAGGFGAWLAGAILALVALVRRRRRAWLRMLIGVVLSLVLAAAGTAWWLQANGML